MKNLKLSDIGEKKIISSFITPLFNPDGISEGVGDDCATIQIRDKNNLLVSTDRVPADFFAYKSGIINNYELGQYTAKLNISDVLACGGDPVAMLLNIACPSNFLYDDFQSIHFGFKDVSEDFSCEILGGDISESSELNIVATSIGVAYEEEVLRRDGAQPGDTIFITADAGLTPAFFAAHSKTQNISSKIETHEIMKLDNHFKTIYPDINLSKALVNSKSCSSCMDNTDGLGQCMIELSKASKVSFIIKNSKIMVPEIVNKISRIINIDPYLFSFSSGVDLSLVGTLKGQWEQKEVESSIHPKITVIGYVEKGNGVYLEKSDGIRTEFECKGWDYFHHTSRKIF